VVGNTTKNAISRTGRSIASVAGGALVRSYGLCWVGLWLEYLGMGLWYHEAFMTETNANNITLRPTIFLSASERMNSKMACS
jgi:hypothetical protein